jgi:hypothetical protein
MRIIAFALLAACSHTSPIDSPDAGPLPSDVDASCGQSLAVSSVQPDVMVALDRSCSMRHVLEGTTQTKWAAAVAAIDNATLTYAQRVRWGLTLFPDKTGDTCAQDEVQVPIADGAGAAMQAMLDAALDPTDPLYPGDPCTTPIDTGIAAAAADPGLADVAHPASIVLVTDGKQSSCALGGGDVGTEDAIRTLFQRGVTTYVVGFGDGVDTAELDKLAKLGGAPLQGTHKYYQADNAGDLDRAVQAIVGAVVSCSYHVDPSPPDLAQTYVWFDHTHMVPRDETHAAGWDFDPASQQLTLYGSYCTDLVQGATTQIDVVFGCPQPPIL